MKLKKHKYNSYLLYGIAILLLILPCYWSITKHFNNNGLATNGNILFEKFNNKALQNIASETIDSSWVQMAINRKFEALQDFADNNKQYFVYAMDNHGYVEPLYWSTRLMVPTLPLIKANDTINFVANSNEYFIYKKQTLLANNKSYIFIVAQLYYKGFDATSKHLYPQWYNTNSAITQYSFTNTDSKIALAKKTGNEKKPYFKYCIVYFLLFIWIIVFYNKKSEYYFNLKWYFIFLPLLAITNILFVYIHNGYLLWDNNYIFLTLQVVFFVYVYLMFLKNVKASNKLIICILLILINALFFAKRTNLINITDISNYSLNHVAFIIALVFALINILLLSVNYFSGLKIPIINNTLKISPYLTRFFVLSLMGAITIGVTNYFLYSTLTTNALQSLVKNVIVTEETQINDLEKLVNNFTEALPSNDVDYQLNTVLKGKLDSFQSVHNSTLTYTTTTEVNNNSLPSILKKIPINNTDSIYLAINNEPKQNIRNTINAELFTSKIGNFAEISNTNYAVYKNNKLLLKNNSIIAPSTLNNGEINILNKNTKQLSTPKGYTVIYEEKKWSWLTFFTSFSYLFIAVLVLSGFFIVGIEGFKSFSINNLPLPQKIFAIISSIVVISFIIISWFIINKFNNEQKENNAKQLTNAAQILINEFKASLNTTESDDAVIMYDLSVNENLRKLMISISSLQNSDINVYDKNGNLEVSTQPYLFNKNFISNYMNFNAWQALYNYNLAQYLTFETIGDLSFQSIYMPITDKNNNVFAYINIPHYTSNKNFEQELNAFMATVINIMAFVLIVALLIGFYFSTIISKPLVAIANSMAKTNIMQYNEPLVYNSKDEIGKLVAQYNLMQKELYASIQKLAKDEREQAWRQMAKQVAHEIKNPLTPMKLKIQLLDRNIALNRGDINQMVKETNTLLIDQINHLAKIASDFSEFAQIESNHKMPLQISNLIAPIVNLYQNENNVHITYLNNAANAIVNADETQLNRLFINLVKNAIEACEEKPNIEIIITQNIKNNKLVNTFIDNGNGIPEEIIDKIFSPNFTTKSSGTGLGLAMCKTIMNQHDGEIYFETGKNGTTFTLIFPLHQP